MRLKDREYAVAFKKTVAGNRINKETEFHVIKNNFLSWTADPFPIEIDGQLYIFAEIYLYTKNKGTIGYSRLTEKGFTNWKVVIEEPYHLSFPNLFWKNGVLYICPESHQNNSLYLYRCESFPDCWVKDKEIAKGDFNDTIYYEQNEEKYLMTYALDNSFHIYKVYGNELVENDVSKYIRDINTSRPAGKVLTDNSNHDELVTQIGKPAYGSGLVFKKFELNWPEYCEWEEFRLTAIDLKLDKKRDYIGLHTFNVSQNYTVIDLIWEEVLLQRIFFRVTRKLKKIFKNENK